MLVEMGWTVHATKGAAEAPQQEGGLESCFVVYKPFVMREPNAFALPKAGRLDLATSGPDSGTPRP